VSEVVAPMEVTGCPRSKAWLNQSLISLTTLSPILNVSRTPMPGHLRELHGSDDGCQTPCAPEQDDLIDTGQPLLAFHTICGSNEASVSLGMQTVFVTQRKPALGEESLGVRCPTVSAEWHQGSNGELTPFDVKPGSSLKVWWRCLKCECEWKAVISNRTKRHSRCPRCSMRLMLVARTTPAPGESLGEVDPALSAEWHQDRNRPLKPADVKPNRALRVWWQCSTCAYEWQASIGERAKGRSCSKCAARRRAAGRASMARGEGHHLPDRLLAEWDADLNDRDASTVTGGSAYKAWWVGLPCGHRWQASVLNRVTHGSGCSVCAIRRRGAAASRPALGQSLADLHPDLAAEWDEQRNSDLNASDVRAGSHRAVWWLCPVCGHSWRATSSSRTSRGSGCRPCAARRRAEK
jgi:DNA-directed RNA polymerase subunit RPC12/RpoP